MTTMIEDLSRDQLDEYHLMRVGPNGQSICYYMQQSNPHQEFLYDLEEDQLHQLNEMLLLGESKDAILLQLHEWADAFLEEDEKSSARWDAVWDALSEEGKEAFLNLSMEDKRVFWALAHEEGEEDA
jgi:hypothetical protein